jgi:hypothetical protein
VVLLDARNHPWDDYSTKDVRVEAFAKGTRVAEEPARFPEKPRRHLAVPLDGVEVDELRITLESWEGTGAGLAEVEVY